MRSWILLPLLASVLLLAGCGAHSHLERIDHNTWNFHWEAYRIADPQILVDVYRAQENITEEDWMLFDNTAYFTVIPGHPKFDGNVTSVKVYLDNNGPVFAAKGGAGYQFGITTAWSVGENLFYNVMPGKHTVVVQVEWQSWKPFWFKGQQTRDLTTWTYAIIDVDQSYLARMDTDPGLFRAAKKDEPQLLVTYLGRLINVTEKKRTMFENSETYLVAVGNDDDGYVKDVIVYLNNVRIPVHKEGVHYTFGVTTGYGSGGNYYYNIGSGNYKFRIEVVKVKPPKPVAQPPGPDGEVYSQFVHSELEVDPTYLGW
ncbi:MAG: hypothetical protein COY66_03020 [Candidatus Kerfeldbacteria bacterium CG_4_10_14_0_8_um_filter_42_10]|uniref:Uncharacterized protein n=1 Tax=Candidatus Kerfeldbacteria bacterium CG_4_10_14_0_8_um_filter_42_10 TaxID=2014248 RepID=A0A2M7RJ68_9BACT|nr:MAG: hypothetical protein COY66_03020 [Candidatus Kerfeldbacteria bacterium CG_4_10_14_0_8_um_filter_42_10]